MSAENQEKQRMSLREFIGSILPPEPKRIPGDNRPLTLGEYFAINPVPNIDDLAALAKGAKKFISKALDK